MTGLGIGLVVSLGVAIGEWIVAPGVGVTESVAAISFYGAVAGLTFHVWKLALQDWKPPFIDRS